MEDSNSDADVDALEGLGFCFAAARRSQLGYSSKRARSQLPANEDGAAENPRDAARCGAISTMRTSCAASPTLKAAAREQCRCRSDRGRAGSSAFSASQNVEEFATTTRFGLFDVQMVSSCDSKSAES